MILDSLCRILFGYFGIYESAKIMYINFKISCILFGIFFLSIMPEKLIGKIGQYLFIFVHYGASTFGVWITMYHLIKLIGYIFIMFQIEINIIIFNQTIF